MSAFRPGLSAPQVHAQLAAALKELQAAERNAVLWFAEIHRRRLYRELGYSSTHQYAAEALGFSRSKTAQFIRLAESLKSLPRLRHSIASGEVPWTKARVVASVATPRTEKRWIDEARASGRRKLEAKVADLRRRARNGAGGGAVGAGQAALAMESLPAGDAGVGAGGPAETTVAGSGRAAGTNEDRPRINEAEIPVTLTLTFSPERYARYRALVEKLRKLGAKEGREDLLLAGLEGLLAARLETTDTRVRPAGDPDPHRGQQARSDTRVHPAAAKRRETSRAAPAAASPRISGVSPYQVIVRLCESCGRGTVPTDRGEKPVSASTLAAILCDARVKRPGKPNRTAVPPALRREAMDRDGYRCRSAGCGRTSFLDVHHIVPKEAGGANVLPNLVTLCAGCHKLAHEHERRYLFR